MLVEVCASSLQSALNAEKAGADRVELCVELGVGGVTPSHGLIQSVLEKLSIPVHVLIRPRSGHFTYADTEFETMQKDMVFCKAMGVHGIVSGVLTPDSQLDERRTKVLVELAHPLHFTFHRAFDWVPDPERTLKVLQAIGVTTVLTSGQQPRAEQGVENLRQWQQHTAMAIMAGGGVGPENAQIFKEAGLSALHLSGTTFVDAVSLEDKIAMNSQKHLSEHHIAVTNSDVIRQTISALNKR